jgi:hypothetical protein
MAALLKNAEGIADCHLLQYHDMSSLQQIL